jgi:hypothetical protein
MTYIISTKSNSFLCVLRRDNILLTPPNATDVDESSRKAMFKVFADVIAGLLPSLCLPVTPSANPSLHGFLPVPGQTKPAASSAPTKLPGAYR